MKPKKGGIGTGLADFNAKLFFNRQKISQDQYEKKMAILAVHIAVKHTRI